MWKVALVAVAGVLLLAPGSAVGDPGFGTVVFIRDTSLRQLHIFAVDADGTRETNLTSNYANAAYISRPDWSPDGRSLAYSQSTGHAMLPSDIFVLDVASGLRRQLTDTSIREGPPQWSPDGGQLAFSRPDGLYVIDAGGSNATRVIDGAVQDFDWSSRREFAYVLGPPASELHVANADGSGDRLIGPGQAPTWSPNGEQLAFLAPVGSDDGTLRVIKRDGTGLRQLSTRLIPTWSRPDWSPNGLKLVFQGRAGAIGEAHIYSVGQDGGGEEQLTRTPATHCCPLWSPDGLQIAYRDGHRYALAAVNADGTCHRPLPGRAPETWRPGTGGSRFRCANLRLSGSVNANIPRGGVVRYRVRVVNQGDFQASAARLDARLTGHVSPVSARSRAGSCRLSRILLRCELAPLAVGDSASVEVLVRAREVGRVASAFTVVSAEADFSPEDNRLALQSTAHPCSLVGTPDGDTMRGSPRRDVICGLAGDDALFARGGADLVLGGPGADTINAGSGLDRVYGGDGNDDVRARDGARDDVVCGRGLDRVAADPGDRVSRTCERVYIRRGSAEQVRRAARPAKRRRR